MKKRFLFVLPLLSFGVAACMQNQISYDGAGDMSDLIDARLQCVKESSGSSSQVSVNVNVNSSAAIDCGVLNMCMASKGYTKAQGNNGRLKVPDEMIVACNQAPTY